MHQKYYVEYILKKKKKKKKKKKENYNLLKNLFLISAI